MNRRQFVKNSAGAVALGALTLSCRKEPPDIDIVTRLIHENDTHLPRLLQRQEDEKNHQWFGGIVDGYGIHSAGATSGFIRNAACALLSQQSKYYYDADVFRRLESAVKFLLKYQHDDGTIDLRTTNFHSTPDTGFVMEWVCAVYGLLTKVDDAGFDPLRSDLKEFIEKAAQALTVGGIHTPNHRWVVCMALARANSLFPNEQYVARIDEWLGEHIDIDPDGQFTEKSSSIYSPLTDRCLITMARLLQREHLYEPVRQNLDMTLYYIHPNGEVVTEASKRQDQYKYGSMAPYYYPYRFMALKDNNARFAFMSTWIEEKPERLVSNLIYFLEDEQLKSELPNPVPLPTNYEKYFSYSNLARFRRENVSATVLADNYTFFSFRKNEAVLQAVRLASAFFGKGQFTGEKLEVVDGIYVMSQKLDGPYYQPFPKDDIPDDGDWEKMDKEKRTKSEIQELRSTIKVMEHDAAFEINIDINGTERVPVAIELAFKHGGRLRNVEDVPSIENAFFLKEGMGQYRYKNQTIEFGPGLHQHRWTQLRGAEQKLDAMCVYLTGFSPFSFKLKVF